MWNWLDSQKIYLAISHPHILTRYMSLRIKFDSNNWNIIPLWERMYMITGVCSIPWYRVAGPGYGVQNNEIKENLAQNRLIWLFLPRTQGVRALPLHPPPRYTGDHDASLQQFVLELTTWSTFQFCLTVNIQHLL